VPSARWGDRALSATLDDYVAALGGRTDRLVLGLPLYGYDWPVVAPAVPAQSAGTASAVLYADCRVRGAAAGWQWDADAHVPWYAYEAGGPRQAWCEDGRSLAEKLALARDRDLAGVAFWALGYEQGDPEVWDAVAEAFPPPDPLPDGLAGEGAADAAVVEDPSGPDAGQDAGPPDAPAEPGTLEDAGSDLGPVDAAAEGEAAPTTDLPAADLPLSDPAGDPGPADPDASAPDARDVAAVDLAADRAGLPAAVDEGPGGDASAGGCGPGVPSGAAGSLLPAGLLALLAARRRRTASPCGTMARRSGDRGPRVA
jgi:hypothetical protein